MFMLHTFFSLPTLTAHLFALVTSVVFAKTHLSSTYKVRAKFYSYQKDIVDSYWSTTFFASWSPRFPHRHRHLSQLFSSHDDFWWVMPIVDISFIQLTITLLTPLSLLMTLPFRPHSFNCFLDPYTP